MTAMVYAHISISSKNADVRKSNQPHNLTPHNVVMLIGNKRDQRLLVPDVEWVALALLSNSSALMLMNGCRKAVARASRVLGKRYV